MNWFLTEIIITKCSLSFLVHVISPLQWEADLHYLIRWRKSRSICSINVHKVPGSPSTPPMIKCFGFNPSFKSASFFCEGLSSSCRLFWNRRFFDGLGAISEYPSCENTEYGIAFRLVSYLVWFHSYLCAWGTMQAYPPLLYPFSLTSFCSQSSHPWSSFSYPFFKPT